MSPHLLPFSNLLKCEQHCISFLDFHPTTTLLPSISCHMYRSMTPWFSVCIGSTILYISHVTVVARPSYSGSVLQYYPGLSQQLDNIQRIHSRICCFSFSSNPATNAQVKLQLYTPSNTDNLCNSAKTHTHRFARVQTTCCELFMGYK